MTREMRIQLASESYDAKLDKVAMLIELIKSVPKLQQKKRGVRRKRKGK